MYAELLRRTAEHLHPKAWDFVQLTRLDRPIGIYLLLWPTLAALLIAGKGNPDWKHVLVFGLGVVLMRSAGCVINDFADRKFDGHVARTRNRPLATGRLRSKEAGVLFAALVLVSFGLVLLTNWQTIALSFGALLVASLYPFMKRYTHCPQVVLGAAYSWGILMAFTAETQAVPWVAWLLYGANLLWTVAYDTYYAMTDREDDLKIGVKSTAILFGRYDRAIILSLQLASLGCLWAAGFMLDLHWPFILGLVGALFCFAWEFYDTRDKAPERCFHAFLHNHWAGLLILLGVWFDYQLY